MNLDQGRPMDQELQDSRVSCFCDPWQFSLGFSFLVQIIEVVPPHRAFVLKKKIEEKKILWYMYKVLNRGYYYTYKYWCNDWKEPSLNQ